MAEALLKARMPESWNEHLEISSAGTSAWDGQPATENAVAVLREKGVELGDHHSALLSREQVVEADLIVVMAEEHADAVVALDPDAASKVLRLGELDPERDETDIADPIGGDRAVYSGSREEIDGLVSHLIEYISDRFNIDS